MQDLNSFPHMKLLANDPSLSAKLSVPIKFAIKKFEQNFNRISKMPNSEKLKDKKAEAIAEIQEDSEQLAGFITDYVKGLSAADAAAQQSSSSAKQDLKDINTELDETKTEIEELFEDLEEMISETNEEDVVFGGCYVDTRQVINQVKNPNFGKKYKLGPDGSKIYQE